MAKRTVTIELDEDRMEAFAEICESMDMSESTAFRIFCACGCGGAGDSVFGQGERRCRRGVPFYGRVQSVCRFSVIDGHRQA